MAQPTEEQLAQQQMDAIKPASNFGSGYAMGASQAYKGGQSAVLNEIPEPVEQKLAVLVSNSPWLTQQPELLNSFAKQENISAQTLSSAANYMLLSGHLSEFAKGQIQQAGGRQSSDTSWGGLLGAARDTWNNVANRVSRFGSDLETAGSNIWDNWKNGILNNVTLANDVNEHGNLMGAIDTMGQNAQSIGTGLFHSAEDVAKVAKSVEQRALTSSNEFISFGYLGANGWNSNPSAGQQDLVNTVTNAIRSSFDLVDPFSSNNAFQIAAHSMAFYQSLAARYGWEYALGYATPSVIAGLATDGAATAASEATLAEEDSLFIAKIQRDLAAGRKVAQEDEETYRAAIQRQIARMRTSAEEEAEKIKRASAVKASRRGAYGVAEKVTSVVSRPVTGLVNAARVAGKSMSSIKMNTAYAITQASASTDSNKNIKALWDKTKNGIAYDASGRPMGTDGQVLAQYFGLDRGNMFFSPVSGLTDFYTKWLGTDPLGAIGKVIGTSNSFYGFTGQLGAWYGGLGIRTADDVFRASRQYARVRRAFQYMATHNAIDIADAFRNTYGDGKNIKASSILQQLGDAKTIEEVEKIHADIATSVAINRNMVPTMTLYEITKASLSKDLSNLLSKHFYGPLATGFRMTVGDLMKADGAFLKENAKAVLKDTGIDVKPNSALLYVYNDDNIRTLTSFARWLQTRFTRDRMYIDDITKRIENQVIRPGSVNAIPAIMDMLRASLMPENVVRGVGDLLLRTDNPQDYINAYRHAVYHAVMRRATAGLDKAELTVFHATSGEKIWEEVVKMTGVDGGGKKGLFIAGKEGAYGSRVFNAETGLEGFAGIGATHLGELRFPRNAELNGLANRMRGFALELAATTPGRELVVRALSLKELEFLATSKNIKLNNLQSNINKTVKIAYRSSPSLRFDKEAMTTEAHEINVGRARFEENGGKVFPTGEFKDTSAAFKRLTGIDSQIQTLEKEQALYKEFVPQVDADVKNKIEQLKKFRDALMRIAYGGDGFLARDAKDHIISAASYEVLEDGTHVVTAHGSSLHNMPGHHAILKELSFSAARRNAGVKFVFDGKEWTPDEAYEIGKTPPLAKNSNADGHLEGVSKVNEIIKSHKDNKNLLPSEQFVKIYDDTRIESASASRKINEISEKIVHQKQHHIFDISGIPDKYQLFPKKSFTEILENLESALSKAQGYKNALESSITLMESQVGSRTYIDSEIRSIINNYRGVEKEKEILSDALRYGYEPPSVQTVLRGIEEPSYSKVVPPPEHSGFQNGIIKALKDELQEKFPGSEEQAQKFIQAIQNFGDQIGHGLFDEIFIKQLGGLNEKYYTRLGQYGFYEKAIQIFDRALENPFKLQTVLIHELWHHLSSFAPKEFISGLRDEMNIARKEYLEKYPLSEFVKSEYFTRTSPEESNYIHELQIRMGGSVEDLDRLEPEDIVWPRLRRYTMGYIERAYCLHNVDEYFAEKMTEKAENALAGSAGKEYSPTIKGARRLFASILGGIQEVHGEKVTQEVFDSFWASRFSHVEQTNLPLEARLHNLDLENFKKFSKKPFENGLEQMVSELYEPKGGLAGQIQKMYGERNPYIMGYQRQVDLLNRFLSRTFVPLALFSGGWALRVSASEAVLNAARFGGWQFFDAKVLQSIAKHEAYGIKLLEDGKAKESTLVRDIVAGALLGVERNLVRSMSQAKRDRMLDDFVGTIMRHNGHLPGGVHGSDDTMFNDHTINQAGPGIVLGTDRKGENITSQTHTGKSARVATVGDPGFASDLRSHISRIANDSLLAPTAKRAEEMAYQEGVRIFGGEDKLPAKIELMNAESRRETIVQAGLKSFRSNEGRKTWAEELEKGALADIEKMDPKVRERFQRDTGRVSEESALRRNSAHEEWAAAIVENYLSSIGGETKDFSFAPWSSLVSQAADPKSIKELSAFEREINRMGSSAPQLIPSLSGHNALMEGSGANFIKRVTDKGHDAILAPIVNNLAREPIFLLQQHEEMEALRPMVMSGIIDEATAQAIADERATMNMVKYVHNPKDKTLWENNMRVAAPFYFAQNQAWRRAFRVMRDDPGAFEKYLKLSLGVTNFISRSSAGGAFPSVYIPGSTWLGSVGAWGANGPLVSHAPGTAFDNLNFGLSADPGSIASVFPTGAQSGVAGFLGLFRPSWGPLITIPGKLMWQALGSTRSNSLALKWVHSFIGDALGPISTNSSLYSDFFPSTVGRNFLDGAIAIANGIGINAITTSAMDSTVNLVLNNAVDNLFKNQYNLVKTTTNFSGINSNTGAKWTSDEIVTYCRAQAELAISNKFNNDPEFAQNFMDQAHSAAIVMFLAKAAISFGMPVATSVQEQFSKNPEFQLIQQEIDPLTNQKYSYVGAVNEFVRRYPESIFDLTAHSISMFTPYPETKSAVELLTNNPQIAKEYPYAAAYLIDRTDKYSPQAYTLETAMNLRSKDSPQEYLNAILTAAGQDYYYNYLSVQTEFGGDGNNPGNNISYLQYAALQTAAKEYGRNSNPTWYAEFAGGARFASEIKSINEMTKMLKDKSIPESVLSKDDRAKFQDLLNQYNTTVAQVKSLKSAKDSAGASAIENAWYAWCNNAATDPYYAKQAYFISSALRSLPNK